MAAYALETSIQIANKDPHPLVYAAYLLEAAMALEESAASRVPSALLKVT